ncbi:hypothetical protein MKK58_14205 [Methylobacterium sp. J-078]|uniref:hypothetical protein n=1 Tax=Methylobacterium sp. J-078 TaxID=2836657 RepID=UPI001FB8ABEA|nr:hypothetical protein [Methylobacterium sp. J-078]MCJ2045672.1 hypothetical protein [Methylobacterium sp. J-078]
MMPVTIDPSQTRSPAAPARPARPNLRVVLLSSLGVLGLAGFAALASSMLGGLAGPQYTRPTIQSAAMTQKASEWPDLRDGVPALAPAKVETVKVANSGPESAKAETVASMTGTVPAEARAPERAASVVAVSAAPKAVATPSPIQTAVAQPAITPAAVTPDVPAPQKRIEAAATPKPARLPPIENAAVLPPARPAALVPVARTATLIPPSPNETTRSRATSGTFTALTSEREAPQKRVAPSPVAHAKPAAVKPVPAKVAAAAAAPEPQAEVEAEHTEVFGMKVPSLAPAGRKLAEGVEALGNAVKNLPNSF